MTPNACALSAWKSSVDCTATSVGISGRLICDALRPEPDGLSLWPSSCDLMVGVVVLVVVAVLVGSIPSAALPPISLFDSFDSGAEAKPNLVRAFSLALDAAS